MQQKQRPRKCLVRHEEGIHEVLLTIYIYNNYWLCTCKAPIYVVIVCPILYGVIRGYVVPGVMWFQGTCGTTKREPFKHIHIARLTRVAT